MSQAEAKKEPAPEVSIRLAEPGDEGLVASLVFDAFAPFRDEYTPDAFEYTALSAGRVRERFSEGPIWIAYVDGEPAGTVSGLPEDKRFYIRSMAIRPAAQRSGVGQLLLDTLEAHARYQGFARLYLYTTFVLPGATGFYRKNGFYIVRETAPEEWFGMGGIEMEKKIG